MFADRPVATYEHDDADLKERPEPNHLQRLMATMALRDGLTNEIDRIMSLDSGRPALDVNAADEVPCSTWFCARNHLHPMTPAQVATAWTPSFRLPLTVSGGKTQGDATGFEVTDAAGQKFLIKLDPSGHLGMTTGAEVAGNAFFHAAGYNVPGAALVEVDEAELRLDPRATYLLYGVQRRPLTRTVLHEQLTSVARLPNGHLRGVLVRWLEGDALGAFDLQGTRPGDPNDRITHERRRSLRASRILFTWLSVLDSGVVNTLDTVVADSGRRFVRHSFIDFGCAFGSATRNVQGLHQDGEYSIEVGRTLAALLSLGIYQRPFQGQRRDYRLMVSNFSAVGYFPAEGFNPDAYRQQWKNPAFMRMTDRDAYWGAKLVTSFTDAQIAEVVAAARLREPDASYLRRALAVRRDILGRRYLRPMAAIEAPAVSPDGASVCFDDLAMARGAVAPAEASYQVDVRDVSPAGQPLGTVKSFVQAATGPRACVPFLAAGSGSGYRVVELRTRLAGGGAGVTGGLTKAARVHLRWRPAESRFVVVGLERDE
jgi:hypothetical protein